MARFWPRPRKAERKEKDELAALTPLERLALDAGPIRPDGTDKFYGFENFGNTCYCNSILQPLFFCEPFRDALLGYDFSTVTSDPRGPPPQVVNRAAWTEPDKAPAIKMNGGAAADGKKKAAAAVVVPSPGAGATPAPPVVGGGTRPEDKPDTPEWKKKQIMIKGPVLELRYEADDAVLGPGDSTLSALQDLFRALLEAETRTGVLSPQRLLQVFKSRHDAFQSPQHQDAHEFLRY
jgi:ubiquitin carboxyl-terminal hydrolase 9/13